LPKAAIGRRPMNLLMATGLPALSSMKSSSGCRTMAGLSPRASYFVTTLLPTTRCGGIPTLRALAPGLPADWQAALTLNDANALTGLMLDSNVIGGSAAYAHAGALRRGELRALPLERPVYHGRVGPVRLRGRNLSAPAERLPKILVEALRRDLAPASI
jgi:hypothetical protein